MRIVSASPSTPVLPTTGSTSPSTPVVLATWSASPSTPVVPSTGTASPSTSGIRTTGSASCPEASPFPSQSPIEVESHHPAADEEGPQLPGHQPCWISGGKIDPGSASRYITSLVHAHIPGPVHSWNEFPPSRYMFTRPEDLHRARVIWESNAQTNFRKSMWEARDKATKTTGSRDPTDWIDYGPATGPWQERSQVAKHNRAALPEENMHTSRSVSYATHSQKLDDGGSLCRGHSPARLGSGGLGRRSGRAEEGPSVRLWRQPGYYSSVVLICEFGCSSGLHEFVCCAARQWWRGHENPHLGRATTAVWHYGRAVDLCHPRSRPLTASPSGQYYY
ncbi:hypothetical protein Taro_015010 [Colocasia esculenta]|uniref:Uncharacterized protein n=1 Tax=Colocasia esculenta TaxID=4460 RepID=A0A843UL43_COLES|nr:hypothetical protein [Colocasia esculenta]